MTGNRDSETMTTEEIERDIAIERARVSEALSALESKLSLGGAVDRLLDGVGGQGGEVLESAKRVARDNPVPLALIAAGVAWLAMGGGPRADELRDGARRMRSRDDDDYYDDMALARDYGVAHSPADPSYRAVDGGSGPAAEASTLRGVRDSADRVGSSVRTGAADLRDGSRAAAQRVGEKASYAAGAARDASRRVAERTGDAAGRSRDAMARTAGAAQRRGEAMFVSNPLATGALAFAVGAIVGGLTPNTRRENAVFGEHADAMRERVREEAGSRASQIGEQARERIDSTVAKARDNIDTAMETARERAEAAVHGAEDKAKAGASDARVRAENTAQSAKAAARGDDVASGPSAANGTR